MTKVRNTLVDCLRGISVIIVAGSHGLFGPSPLQPPDFILPFLKGYFGVVLFFVLSGFLITRNSLERYGRLSDIDMREFYTMRIGRIAPCLLLFLVAMTVLYLIGVAPFVPSSSSLVASGIYNALTLQYNWFYLAAGNVPGMAAWAPLWSLAVEELFYVVFPIACFFTRRTPVLLLLLVGLIVYGPIARSEHIGFYTFWGNADLLAIGCITGLLAHRFPLPAEKDKIGTRICWASAIVGILLIGFLPVSFETPIAPTLIAIAAATFLFGTTGCQYKPSGLISPVVKTMAAFGRYSYEIYLFHTAWILLVAHVLPAHLNGAFRLGVVALLTGGLLALGRLIALYYSEPANRAIRTFYRSSPVGSKNFLICSDNASIHENINASRMVADS